MTDVQSNPIHMVYIISSYQKKKGFVIWKSEF